jgi:hypothetical protein
VVWGEVLRAGGETLCVGTSDRGNPSAPLVVVEVEVGAAAQDLAILLA